jgi:hypothetical protein
VPQKPIDGTSLLYSFADAKAPERHSTQYFEVFGHRAIYHDGWMASAFHSRLPWSGIDFSNKKFDDDKWELYNLDKDFSQADDLATQQPVKLAELKALFTSEAERNQVLPLRNTALPGANGLPTLSAGRTSVSYHEGAIGIPESALPRTYNRSWSVSATVDLSRDARGVIATLGGSSAGWSLYLDPNQMPLFTYRLFDIKTVTLKGPKQLTPVGEDHLPGSPTSFYTIDESFDVGLDHGSPAGFYPADAEPGYRFQGGHIEVVTVTVGADGNISSQKR